jgi:hypothetical protein
LKHYDSLFEIWVTASASASADQPALVDGAGGVVVAPHGRLLMVLHFSFEQFMDSGCT